MIGSEQTTGQPYIKDFSLNLAQAAATYDGFTATGDVLVAVEDAYMMTAGATFTSVSLQTNDTSALEIMSAAEGAVANLGALKHVTFANRARLFKLANGKKLQFTIIGSTGTGVMVLTTRFYQITAGASLS